VAEITPEVLAKWRFVAPEIFKTMMDEYHEVRESNEYATEDVKKRFDSP